MKTATLVCILLLTFSMQAHSQDPGSNPLCRSEIGKLEFMTGKWSGTAWMIGSDREKHSFEMSQIVQFKLDTTLLQIERTGMVEGQIIHSELAIISFAKSDTTYIFDSFLSNGHSGRFTGVLSGNRFYWYPYDNTGYAITINEKGQWYEIGQMRNKDKVIQFFEMTLDKK
jgi:hypothetical protein